MMKKQLLIASAALLSITAAHAGDEGWTHDFKAAKNQAAKEGKDLLIDFTGSDWCQPCKDLSKRVLSTDDFKTAAAKAFVLVELDFPRTKEGLAMLSDATKKQNNELHELYEVRRLPSILLTDSKGRPYAMTGIRPGGPAEYLAHLSTLQEARTARDEQFSKANKANGIDKANLLGKTLLGMPWEFHKHYPEIVSELKKLDPKNEGGLVVARKKKEDEEAAKKALMTQMSGLEKQIGEAMNANDPEKAIKHIDDFIAAGKLEGLKKQQVLSTKIQVYMHTKDLDAVEKVLTEIIAVDPQTDFAKQVESYKNTGFKTMKEAQK